MTSALQPYPAYQDSGVDWLGNVPHHWEVRALGTFGRFFKGGGGTKADETARGVSCIRYGDLYTRHQFHITESRACVAPYRAGAYTPIRHGDVLFAGSGETLEEIGKSAVNLIRGSAVCGGDVIGFRPTIDLDAEFIGWSTDCREAASQKARMGRGITVMHIYSSDLKHLAVPLPPLPEQRAIARYLNHADRRIQRYIRAKERLIELLEERKRALIHEAVTGRIDVRTGQPYSAYKDSGVDWLGKVPEHWDVRRLKTLSSMQSGEAITAMSINPTGDYRVFGGNGLRGYTSDYTHDGEFALIGRQGALCGNIHLARGRFWASEHAVVATLSPAHVLEWFGALLEVMDLNRYSIAAAQPGLSVDRVLHLWAPVPPAEEQVLMSKSLVERSREMAYALETAKRQIALLNEYRTRLIADVVTGKLDVREPSAKLPETDRLARNRDRAETISADSNLHSTEYDMAKEAVP